jgi:alkylation response protein AidB-like acyl-CoA dehydrogenase
MIFPANEATFIDTWKTSGLRGTGSGDFEVADLIVPPERSVSLTDDQPICTGALYRFPIFGLLSIGIASVASGNALAALEEFKATALAKRHAGGRVMAERSAVQGLFAGAFIELRGARAVFMEEIDAAWRQANAGKTITAEQRGRLRLSATHLTRTSAEIVRRLQDAAGGDAVFLDNALNRRVLDAQTMTAHIMVAPATIELAGRALLGLPVSSLEL